MKYVFTSTIITKESELCIMSKRKEKDSPSKNEQTTKDDSDVDISVENNHLKVSIPVKKAIGFLLLTAVPLIFAAGMCYQNVNGDMENLKGGIDKIYGRLNDMQEDVDDMQGDVGSIGSKLAENKLELFEYVDKRINKKFEDIEDDFDKLDDKVSNIKTVYLLDDKMSCLKLEKNEHDMYETENPSWNDGEIIATDPSTNESFSASELADQRILVPYEMNGQNIIFCGQYNKNNHWDGRCVINAYKNGLLTVITEAVYADGVLVKYKQAISDVNTSKKSVWIISNRVSDGGINSGNSWSYIRKGGYKQKFKLENVSSDDIVSVNEFKKDVCHVLEGFYHGNTSNGKYNDDTGSAYLVKYDSWGYVRTLYVGRFENGVFEDDTGNAWYIVRDEDKNTDYAYYQGVFHNGDPSHSKKDIFINPYTLDQVDNKIKDYQFDCVLPWYAREKHTL